MIKAVPVSLYRLPQDVALGIELDSRAENGLHGFSSSCVSFEVRLIRNVIFNNRVPDEYGLGKRRRLE